MRVYCGRVLVNTMSHVIPPCMRSPEHQKERVLLGSHQKQLLNTLVHVFACKRHPHYAEDHKAVTQWPIYQTPCPSACVCPCRKNEHS